MLFALSLTNYHRRGFYIDKTRLDEVIQYIHDCGHETGYIGYEIQDEGLHNLHLHTTISVEKFIDMYNLHKYAKGCDIHCHIIELKTKKDMYNWNVYVHKRKYDLHLAYADSCRAEPRQNLFSECWEKMKRKALATASLAPKDTLHIGCWKCDNPKCYLNGAEID